MHKSNVLLQGEPGKEGTNGTAGIAGEPGARGQQGPRVITCTCTFNVAPIG